MRYLVKRLVGAPHNYRHRDSDGVMKEILAAGTIFLSPPPRDPYMEVKEISDAEAEKHLATQAKEAAKAAPASGDASPTPAPTTAPTTTAPTKAKGRKVVAPPSKTEKKPKGKGKAKKTTQAKEAAKE